MIFPGGEVTPGSHRPNVWSIDSMGAIRWGRGGRVPPTFSDSGDIICHVSSHFLFRYRNILVSHQPVPPTFYNKIAPMIDSECKTKI